jgi:GntR family transcriptional regulator / MocR family aminotransferase
MSPRKASSALPSHVLHGFGVDRQRGHSLKEQLARSLRQAIFSGTLPQGFKLPPSREVALQLAIGRNTVVDAYAQLLAEGLIETQGRHGSMVAAVTQANKPPKKAKTQDKSTNHDPAKDWRLGQACVQLLPLKAWRAASKEIGRHLPPTGYGDPRGELGLRIAIATWLRQQRGVSYEPSQIVVTQGASMAVDLLMQLLLSQGKICVVESPGYPRAQASAQRLSAVVRKVPVDAQGMRISEAFLGHPPALIHLTPSHQYPLGSRLSGTRRRELIQLARRHGSWIIENEYDHEFIYEGHNYAPIAAALPEQTVLVSTFAKAISPSLRLGFIAAPLSVAQGLAELVEAQRLHVSWPVQRLIQALLQSGELQKHLRRVRRHYAGMRQALLGLLSDHCPRLHVSGHAGGLHVVLHAATETSNRKLAARLHQTDVVFQTLQDFGVDRPTLLLAYGHMQQQDLSQAVSLLEQACKAVKL